MTHTHQLPFKNKPNTSIIQIRTKQNKTNKHIVILMITNTINKYQNKSKSKKWINNNNETQHTINQYAFIDSKVYTHTHIMTIIQYKCLQNIQSNRQKFKIEEINYIFTHKTQTQNKTNKIQQHKHNHTKQNKRHNTHTYICIFIIIKHNIYIYEDKERQHKQNTTHQHKGRTTHSTWTNTIHISIT